MADEEGRGVVAGDVPVAFFGVELEGEAARVALGVGGTFFAADGGEANEGGGLFADGVEKPGGGEFGHVRVGADKITVGAGTFRVDHAFGNALAIALSHFFKEQEVF